MMMRHLAVWVSVTVGGLGQRHEECKKAEKNIIRSIIQCLLASCHVFCLSVPVT